MTVAERKPSVAFFCATESAIRGATGREGFFVHEVQKRVRYTDVGASIDSKASGRASDDLFVP